MSANCQKFGCGGLCQNVSLYFSYLFTEVHELVFLVMSISQNPNAESNWQFGVIFCTSDDSIRAETCWRKSNVT